MKKWYERKRYILPVFLLLPPLGTFLLWKHKKIHPLIKGALILYCLLWLTISIGMGSSPKEEKSDIVPEPSPIAATTEMVTPQPTETAEVEQKTVLGSIEDIVSTVTGDQAVPAIFHGDEFATEENAPYNVIVNFSMQHNISSCWVAQTMSYDIMKALYSDQDVRKKIDRVLVTIPYFLRTSLGASDGVPLAENNSFSGPTNYWKLMSDVRFSYEDESGELSDRTWGVLFGNCIE
jgi:hypothetical protein